MNINSLLGILFSTSGLMLTQGCGTLSTHGNPEKPDAPRVYRGTQHDANLLRRAIAPRETDEAHEDTEQRALILAGSPFLFADLALSFVADTLLLPYDATRPQPRESK
jgi:uncharacterized protein YceK